MPRSVREVLYNAYIYMYVCTAEICCFQLPSFWLLFSRFFPHCMDLPGSPVCKRQKFMVLCSFRLKNSVKSVEVMEAGEAMHFWTSSSPQCLNSLALFQWKLDFHRIVAGPHLGDCAMWATTVLRWILSLSCTCFPGRSEGRSSATLK